MQAGQRQPGTSGILLLPSGEELRFALADLFGRKLLDAPAQHPLLAEGVAQAAAALAATWRAHSCSGTGPNPGEFEIEEDEDKFTFRMNPCGSGQRLWRNGAYRGPNAMGVTEEAHEWSYGRKGFPLYCTHCSFMNEIQPIEWIGYPMYPSDPPDDYDRDPCTWYWYKDPADIPERHWARYGLSKPTAGAGS